MNIKLGVPEILAAAVLMPGALAVPALALEPATAVNSTAKLPEDASTPVHAANDVDDNRVTQQIISAVRADTSLSQEARNVSVATNPQAIILRGAVSSSDVDRIETLAEQYAGARQVDNQLTVQDHADSDGHHLPMGRAPR
jgi:osmotically-inducible protein OsmY